MTVADVERSEQDPGAWWPRGWRRLHVVILCFALATVVALIRAARDSAAGYRPSVDVRCLDYVLSRRAVETVRAVVGALGARHRDPVRIPAGATIFSLALSASLAIHRAGIEFPPPYPLDLSESSTRQYREGPTQFTCRLAIRSGFLDSATQPESGPRPSCAAHRRPLRHRRLPATRRCVCCRAWCSSTLAPSRLPPCR